MSQFPELPISPLEVGLSRHDLQRLLALVRLLFRLSQTDSYRQLVLPQLPECARFDPGHAALMMGYDFHLTPDGPRLIEVNTNAGGGYFAWLSSARAEGLVEATQLPERLQQRLLASFKREWHDFSAEQAPLQRVLLVDESPAEQALYPEMLSCCDWLRGLGLQADIAASEQLTADERGVFYAGERIDLIYNRHCDFYLESQELAGLRAAYLAGSVCLSPNPYAYGLLADKRRMCLWSDEQILIELGLDDSQRQRLLSMVPQSRMLSEYDLEQLWQQRKDNVFKPVTRYASKGVLLGRKITRGRFTELDPAMTLVQRLVPPSVVTGEDGQQFKTDLRLFVYRDRLLGIGARLYQGQLTNLRTPGGGFAPVRLV